MSRQERAADRSVLFRPGKVMDVWRADRRAGRRKGRR